MTMAEFILETNYPTLKLHQKMIYPSQPPGMDNSSRYKSSVKANYVAKDHLQLIRLSACLVDLPQFDLMNFRVEYVRSRSCRASNEVARGPAGTEKIRGRTFQKVYMSWKQTNLLKPNLTT